jgi:hypothetical protein
LNQDVSFCYFLLNNIFSNCAVDCFPNIQRWVIMGKFELEHNYD